MEEKTNKYFGISLEIACSWNKWINLLQGIISLNLKKHLWMEKQKRKNKEFKELWEPLFFPFFSPRHKELSTHYSRRK